MCDTQKDAYKNALTCVTVEPINTANEAVSHARPYAHIHMQSRQAYDYVQLLITVHIIRPTLR